VDRRDRNHRNHATVDDDARRHRSKNYKINNDLHGRAIHIVKVTIEYRNPRSPLAPKTTRPLNDVVFTHPELAKRLIEHFKPTGRILDPCRGERRGSLLQ
jgi:acetylornithine/succinyldiaminopimelate/putrescine aminotransferase